MWTQFMDMNSGGGRKEPYSYLYIEAPMDEAIVIFYNRFGHSPTRVTCTCCGEDYSINENETIEQATGYERNCEWSGDKYAEQANSKRQYAGAYMTVEEYVKKDSVLIIPASEIKPEEKKGEVPEQGYVWKD